MSKFQVRVGVFETNSSSTHSLTIVTQEEYDAWLRGEQTIDGEDVDAYNECIEYYEEFVKYFTTPSGDKMVAFGFYGRD